MLWLLSALPAFAAIDGTVINRTTSRPQPNATVTLTRLGEGGMIPAGSVKSDANGKFAFEEGVMGGHLLQVSHGGVSYSTVLTPGTPTTGLELAVYEASRARGSAAVEQHMVLLETNGQEIVVNETVIYKNDGLTTWSNPNEGTLQFYVPEAGQRQIRVRALAPNGMPVERTALKSRQKNVYYVDFPVKPGETRFDMSYKMPVEGAPAFASRRMHNEGKVRLVVPSGITAEGTGITLLGKEPTTQASIYDVTAPAYTVKLSGTGSMRALEPSARGEDEGPRVEPIQPKIYGQLGWILGLSLTFLGLSFWTLYQRGARPQV